MDPTPTQTQQPTAPAGPPGWGYPEGYVPPPPPPPAPVRPGSVTAAGVLLIVLGVLVGLFGLISLLAGALFPTVADTQEFRDQFGEVSSALGGLLLTMGAIVLGFGALQVVAGIFVLPGRTWARIMGLVLAVLGILFSLVGVLPGENGAGASIVFVVLLAGYAYAAWILASTGWWFTR